MPGSRSTSDNAGMARIHGWRGACRPTGGRNGPFGGSRPTEETREWSWAIVAGAMVLTGMYLEHATVTPYPGPISTRGTRISTYGAGFILTGGAFMVGKYAASEDIVKRCQLSFARGRRIN